MKKIIILLISSLVALVAMAGDNANSSLNERFYQAKLRELTYRLHINAEQQKKFEPIYRAYCEDMTALWNERKNPMKPNASNSAAAIEKRKMEMQQRAQGIRMRYIDQFATVLNANQVEHLFEVESIIQKKLKQRKDHPRGQ